MTGSEPEDQLGLALTELDRFIEIWTNLAASNAECSAIRALIAQKAEDLKSSEQITSSSIGFAHIQRSAALRASTA